LQKVADLNQEPRLNTIEEILEDIRAGRMVVIMDDEDRENEGDLVMAATMVTPEDINFMARYGRGLICLTLNRARCRQLRLPLMVTDTDTDRSTNFTVSIEAAEGVTTGISAHDRAHTIRTAVGIDAEPEDLRQPGHIFPLMAQPGGVLTRAGHTEAGCDLARLAGLEAAAVIVEILNEDGTMARRPDLLAFAREHGLKVGRIADLIRYRLQKEESVEPISENVVETEFGEFRMVCFEDHVHQNVHLALVKGEPGDATRSGPLVRVQLLDTLRDVVGIRSPESGWHLRAALRRIAEDGCGVLVLLRGHDTPRDLMDSIDRLAGVEDFRLRDGQESIVLRTYGIGAQILRNLGVRKMRVLSAPKQMSGLSGFGLQVVEYVE
jgi:3,4-dihydroxy 2-butanone 4-phosphate synthase/GTP cyclohydrolase II